MRLTNLLSWIGLGLGAAYLVFFGVAALFGNGLEALVLGTPFYVVPLVAIGLLLRSSRRTWRTVAGWLALLPAAFYVFADFANLFAAVGGGWGSFFSLALETAHLLAYFLVVFWATVLHHPGHKAPMTPATS